MKHEDLRTDDEKFDDWLSEGATLDEIAFRLGWSWWRTERHYRQVCDQMGELPDEE